MVKKWAIYSVFISILLIVAVFFLFRNSPENSDFNLNISSNNEIPENLEQIEASDYRSKPSGADNRGSNPEALGCSGNGNVNFTFSPRNLEDIGLIEPTGLMIGNHVTPIDHGYFYPKVWKQEPELSDLTDVFAPADGIITQIQRMPSYFSTKNPDFEDYRLVIHHTCTFYTIYIHLYKLSPKIKEKIDELSLSQNIYPKIEVKAGELIGRAFAFDFSVHDDEKTLSGFLVPEHYSREPWKIHTVDMFEPFIEPIKSRLLEKNIRSSEPYGGKIDYDLEGKLIGNWFVENTNGYMGVKQPDYWGTHASFSPDALDSGHFIISLGDFNGEAIQFGAKGNSPKPEEVSISSGIVKYELVDFEYKVGNTGDYWNRTSLAKSLIAENKHEVKGVISVQVLSGNKMKMEIFPGKLESDVSGFTSNARIYER